MWIRLFKIAQAVYSFSTFDVFLKLSLSQEQKHEQAQCVVCYTELFIACIKQGLHKTGNGSKTYKVCLILISSNNTFISENLQYI